MKKLIIGFLMIGSLTYAGNTGLENAELGIADVPESCDIAPECSSLSPIGRGFCVLKGMFQGCLGGACGLACLSLYLHEKNNNHKLGKNFAMFAFATLVVGTDSLYRSARNLSTAME